MAAGREQEPHLGRVVWTLLGGVIGAALVLFLQTGEIRLIPTMKYEDLAAVLLSAVGVIVAVFGVGLAILAFWGFSQLKSESIKAAVAAASLQVDELIRQEIASPEMERRIRQRVTQIVLGNERDAELDAEPEYEGDEGA
jgi:hypothetical protein